MLLQTQHYNKLFQYAQAKVTKTATTELVVPRSIPTAFAMMCSAPDCFGVIRGFLVSTTLGVVEEPHNPQTIKVECISLSICHIGQNWQ